MATAIRAEIKSKPVERVCTPAEPAPGAVGFMLNQRHRRVAISVSGADWNDPASWGCMLADFARQIGDVYEVRLGISREQALAKMRTLLEAEWDYPSTDNRTRRARGTPQS